MKKCSRCQNEKDISQFWKRSDRKAGYHGVCKDCMNSDRPKRNKKNASKLKTQRRECYLRYREKRIEEVKKYYSSLSEEKREEIRQRKRINFKNSDAQKKNKLDYQRNRYSKEKIVANRAIAQALIEEKIFKPGKCQICNLERKLDGHHSDYSKPLEVIWVCRKCHVAIHKRLKERTVGKNGSQRNKFGEV